ncbi:MAG: S-layer homology domain-containing protein [Candidatus Woesearchaeota archaeon]
MKKHYNKLTLFLILVFVLTTTSSSIYSASIFTDINNHWAKNHIITLNNSNIITGYPDKTFRPENTMSVAEFLAFTTRVVFKEKNIPNIDGAWYSKYISISKEYSIIEPNDFNDYSRPITREEMAKITVRALGVSPLFENSPFVDANECDESLLPYVNKLKELGIIKGYPDETFKPKNNIKRGEASVILSELMKQANKGLKPSKNYNDYYLKHQPNTNTQVPILCYHAFTTDKSVAQNDLIYVTAEKFEKDLKYLKENDYTPVFVKDLNKPLPKNPVVITIDDGYKDNYDIAYPLIKKYNSKATISIIGLYIDEQIGREKFDWTQAKEMVDSGFIDIQHHTYDLHRTEGFTNNGLACNKGVLKLETESINEYKKRITDDFLILKEKIESNLGYTPTVFTYPYGKYNQISEEVYKDLGIEFTLSTRHGIANMNDGNYLLKRLDVNEYTILDDILQ